MTLWRDSHLTLATRRLNALRMERLKRIRSASNTATQLVLRAIMADDGSTPMARAFCKQQINKQSSWQRKTKHRSRCWFSARARQVRRSTLLARMHLRSHMAQGILPGLTLRRT